jgi:hypothetical protein
MEASGRDEPCRKPAATAERTSETVNIPDIVGNSTVSAS